MRVNLLALLEGLYVTPTYTTSIKFHFTLSFYSINHSITEHFLCTNPCEEYQGFRENSIHLPLLISILRAWGVQQGRLPRASKPQEQDLGQDHVRLAPRIAGNCLIKGQGKPEWVGGRLGRRNQRRQTSRPQETDAEEIREKSGSRWKDGPRGQWRIKSIGGRDPHWAHW